MSMCLSLIDVTFYIELYNTEYTFLAAKGKIILGKRGGFPPIQENPITILSHAFFSAHREVRIHELKFHAITSGFKSARRMLEYPLQSASCDSIM